MLCSALSKIIYFTNGSLSIAFPFFIAREDCVISFIFLLPYFLAATVCGDPRLSTFNAVFAQVGAVVAAGMAVASFLFSSATGAVRACRGASPRARKPGSSISWGQG
jgi:hypothetical protein